MMTQRRKDSMTQRLNDVKTQSTLRFQVVTFSLTTFLLQQAGASRQAQAGRRKQAASRQPQTVTNSSSNRYFISFAFFLLFLGLVAGNAFCLTSGVWRLASGVWRLASGGRDPPTRLGLFLKPRHHAQFWNIPQPTSTLTAADICRSPTSSAPTSAAPRPSAPRPSAPTSSSPTSPSPTSSAPSPSDRYACRSVSFQCCSPSTIINSVHGDQCSL